MNKWLWVAILLAVGYFVLPMIFPRRAKSASG